MKVLVFGDSLVYGLEKGLKGFHVESYPGHLARDMHEQLNVCLKDNYDVVVLCLGINDLGHGLLPQDVVQSLLELHTMIRKHKSKIVAVLLHSDYNFFNEMYSEASEDDVLFCGFFYDLKQKDLQSDGIHLSVKGTKHMQHYLQQFLNEEVDGSQLEHGTKESGSK